MAEIGGLLGLLGLFSPPPLEFIFKKRLSLKLNIFKICTNNLNVQILQTFQILSQHILNDSKFLSNSLCHYN